MNPAHFDEKFTLFETHRALLNSYFCNNVEGICRREGLKVPQKQKPRGRLWLNDGSCVRLRPERANHVWSYDFVSAQTHDGRTLRM